MKKILQDEDINQAAQSFFEATDFAPIAVQNPAAPTAVHLHQDIRCLDNFLAAVKWIFLYIPGTAVIHLIAMGFALLFFYGDWSLGIALGTWGAIAVGTFMVMLGVGKLSDLDYLRVPAAIFAASGLAAVLYSLLVVFIPGDFFGRFTQLTLPLPLLIGYLMKRNVDRQADVS